MLFDVGVYHFDIHLDQLNALFLGHDHDRSSKYIETFEISTAAITTTTAAAI